MAASTADKALIVPQKYSDALDRFGFKYHVEHNFDMSQIDLGRWLQTRDEENYAPKDQVERYAVQMSSSVFPGVLFSNDIVGIDGRGRIAARQKRGDNFIAAIILDESYEAADEKRRHEMSLLGGILNSQDAFPLAKHEMRRKVRDAIALNWTPQVIGKELGAPPNMINEVRRELAAEARLGDLGIELGTKDNGKEKLTGPALRAISSQQVTSLNDEPLRKLANLTIDAGLSAREVFALAKDMHAGGSDAVQTDLIEQQRAEMETRIRDHENSNNGRPPNSRQLRQRLGWINGFAGEEHRLVEHSAAAGQVAIDALTSSIDVLTVTLRLQRERARA